MAKPKIPKHIQKRIDEKMAQLYKDIDFRLQLERETKDLKTNEEINNYIKSATLKAKAEATLKAKAEATEEVNK